MKTYDIKDFLEVKGTGAPSFNYDGSLVVYKSNETGTAQLYVHTRSTGEVEQITSFSDSVSAGTFSPIKNEILFCKDEGGNELKQIYIYSYDTKETKNVTHDPKVRYNFGCYSHDGKYIAYSSTKRNGADFDVYIHNLETDEVTCVFDLGESSHPLNFSPSGKQLIVKQNHSNLNHDIYLVTLESMHVELLTKHEGDLYLSGAVWTHDESSFFTTTNKDRDFIGLSKYSCEKKAFEYAFTPEWDVNTFSISFDGSLLGLIVNEAGYGVLKVFSLPMFEEINIDLHVVGSIYSVKFSRDSKHMALTIGDSKHTTDAWIYSFETKTLIQLTHSTQGVPPEELVEPQLISYTSFDGLEIPAFLYLPKDIEGKKVPVIVNIHGGPEEQYTPSLAPLTQYFLYQGYAVIAPNVRGSSGYGKKYLSLDDIEKRLDSVKDLAFLHAYIKTNPYVDESKVALMGGSYGGFMTLAGLAFYPELWAGGVDIVGIANFVTFLEKTAPYRRVIREAEYGSLEKDRELLHSISPSNHVDKIKAPLMLIHGANDPRVPLSEAKQMVEKLEALGRKTELLVYEDEGHGLSKLKNRLDAYPKVAEFLKEIFK